MQFRVSCDHKQVSPGSTETDKEFIGRDQAMPIQSDTHGFFFMRYGFLLAVLFLCVSEARGIDFSSSLGFAFAYGNSQSLSIQFNGKLASQTDTWSFRSHIQAFYSSTNDPTKATDRQNLQLFLDRKFASSAHTGLLVELERDDPSGIYLRTTLGPYIRQTLKKQNSFSWDIEIGIVWTGENRAYHERLRQFEYHISSNLTWDFARRMTLTHSLKILGNRPIQKQYRLDTDIQVAVKINSALSMGYTLQFRYLNTPPPQVGKIDGSILLVFTYQHKGHPS